MSDTSSATLRQHFAPTDTFARRHIGPSEQEIQQMLEVVGYDSLDALMRDTVPASILKDDPMDLPQARSESQMLARAKELASQNAAYRPFIGMGYHPAVVPGVIARNIFENPAWYTQYTPYQPEIAQGRLEALLNFQTMVVDLTGMDVANASLLDEGSAAAEGMTLCFNAARGKRPVFLVSSACHPQTIDVVRTRATPMGIDVRVIDGIEDAEISTDVCGVLVQYPATDGGVISYAALAERAHAMKALVVVAADPLALTLLESPGAWGADVVVGSTQRFGVPLGFGGPHAAYFATRDTHKRKIPGRLVGISKDAQGNSALRLALQAREQHIRRDKATSNICTSQVLLAVMAGMYGVYHGPEGLREIALRVQRYARAFGAAAIALGYEVNTGALFDTVWVKVQGARRTDLFERLDDARMEVRALDDARVSVTFDEAVTLEQLQALVDAFDTQGQGVDVLEVSSDLELGFGEGLARATPYMTHETFHQYHSEHEMLRYMYRLQQKDLSLTSSMIPLGSCTMKLNATSEMMPVGMEGFSNIHPYTDLKHVKGYTTLIEELELWLGEITGLPGVSLQPNSGAQGEYAGLLAVRAYHASRGEAHRNICLIPSSAHGTNPASAVMAGMKVVVVACDELGNVDIEDLRAKAQAHGDNLSALMITYPSTHGVFEQGIREICEIVHELGGQVYMDGANMNAQVGLCKPGDFGVDVCHLNLHKTFCIPHGGGGPGVGPIAVAEHLRGCLPGHGVVALDGRQDVGPVASAPWGSASILPISWMYIGMMGPEGLKRATQVAILNANYLAARLKGAYELLYTGTNGLVAHEFILDLRAVAASTGITVVDLAKRLMDYGFHAPTMSWPVAGTLMIEPTESETQAELDRFAEAMLAIREEIAQVEREEVSKEDNILKHAPHTAQELMGDVWERPYTRQMAAFPTETTRRAKFWPSVGRLDDAYGDRNLQCSCAPLEDYAAE